MARATDLWASLKMLMSNPTKHVGNKPPRVTREKNVQPNDLNLQHISDRVSRTATLATKDAVVDESLEDTVKDLGAYAILLLARPNVDALSSQ